MKSHHAINCGGAQKEEGAAAKQQGRLDGIAVGEKQKNEAEEVEDGCY